MRVRFRPRFAKQPSAAYRVPDFPESLSIKRRVVLMTGADFAASASADFATAFSFAKLAAFPFAEPAAFSFVASAFVLHFDSPVILLSTFAPAELSQLGSSAAVFWMA